MRRSIWTGVLATVALAGTSLIGAPASALAPDNNDFATPTELSGTESGSAAVTTAEATSDGFPVLHVASGWVDTDDFDGRSVWFTWTAPDEVGPTSFVVADETEAADPILGIYTDDGTALTEIAYNIYSPEDEMWSRSQIDFTPTAGTAYVIGVGSWNNPLTATLTWGPYEEPANDDFASAPQLPTSATGSTVHATLESGEPTEGGYGDLGGRSVWYQFTPTEASTVTIDLDGSTYDTMLALVTGTLADLTILEHDDDGSAGYHDSRIQYLVEAGTTYHVGIGGYGGYYGDNGQPLEFGDSGTFVLTATINAGTIPGTVATPEVTAIGDGSVTLGWTAPDDGGSAITGYEIRHNGTSWAPFDVGLVTSYSVTGLTNGSNYDFQVRAYNVNGYGPWSEIVRGSPSTVPGAPGSIAVVGQGDGYVDLQWTSAANGGSPLTSFTLAYRPQGSADEWSTTTIPVASRTNRVGGLTNGVTYEFKLLAVNANGPGPYTSIVTGMPRSTGVVITSVVISKGSVHLTLDGTGVPLPTIYECRLNNSTWETCTPGVTWVHKAKGARVAYVHARTATETTWVETSTSLRTK